jgi:4-diphosphocytidyl-2-C-methyl-D-erythritol kinase
VFTSKKYVWLPSPAKLNLFLHICGRYENGYHKLQSLFQLLDVGDEIGFRQAKDDRIYLHDHIPGLAQSDNLIFKAAEALMPYRKNKYGVDIQVKKHIPMGGGLGGGSSNAATVLVALNQFWNCGLSLDGLAKIGLGLGADVPIFVHGHTAFAQGVGEVLSPCETPQYYFLVATPHVHISTAEVFSHPDLPRNTPEIDFANYKFENTRNDCQKLVCDAHSKVANLLLWLLNYAPSRMTGTGASVFAVFTQQEQAQKVLEMLPQGVSGFVAQGINRSPLHALCSVA